MVIAILANTMYFYIVQLLSRLKVGGITHPNVSI